MAPLFFTCPKTNQLAQTGVETDVQSLSAAWKATLKVNCPHCGEMHEISVRDEYINGALDDAADQLRQVILGRLPSI
jgi:phage FluMu protein Com